MYNITKGRWTMDKCTKRFDWLGYIFTSTLLFCVCLGIVVFLPLVAPLQANVGVWTSYTASGFAGGSGTQTSPYLISTPEQLALLAYRVNNNKYYTQTGSLNSLTDSDSSVSTYEAVGTKVYYSTLCYSLTNSIDLTGHDWVPIGKTDYVFSGTFDGCGFTINNVVFSTSNISGTNYRYGLFASTASGSTIKNLSVNVDYASSSTSTIYLGGIVGEAAGTIDRCSVYGTIKSTGGKSSSTLTSYVGGIAGYTSGGITNSYNNAAITSYSFVGGICGKCERLNNYTVIIHNCFNLATIKSEKSVTNNSTDIANYKTNCGVGGIVGECVETEWDYSYWSEINNCYNIGTISARFNVGGIVGKDDHHTKINMCYNSANINGCYNIGGIAGISEANIDHCYNNGQISRVSTSYTGVSKIGGIVGEYVNSRSDLRMKYVYNTGTITDNYNGCFLGGIAGYVGLPELESSHNVAIYYAYNSGNVNSVGNYVGGIVGALSYGIFGSAYLSGTKTLYKCKNTGNVTGKIFVGGIAGLAKFYYGEALVNYGRITGDSSVGGIFGNLTKVATGNSSLYTTILLYCYNRGAITGFEECIGGIVGELYEEFGVNAYIYQSYSMGKISNSSGDNKYTGGIVGRNYLNRGDVYTTFMLTGSAPDSLGTSGGGGTSYTYTYKIAQSKFKDTSTTYDCVLKVGSSGYRIISECLGTDDYDSSGYPIYTAVEALSDSSNCLTIAAWAASEDNGNNKIWEMSSSILDGKPHIIGMYW